MPLGNKTDRTYDEKKNFKTKLLWFDIYVIPESVKLNASQSTKSLYF